MSASCDPNGANCATGATCCSSTCDPTAHICIQNPTCAGETQPCNVPTDCCNLSCVNNVCAMTTGCIGDNMACGGGVPGACCSGTCGANGTCTPLNPFCLTSGNPCTPGGDAGVGGGCCSQLCKNGTCALAVSYCTQPGDVCYRDGECCSGLCQLADGGVAGTCADIATLTNTGCQVDGVICNGCATCCSKLCAPFGPSGVNICQPAGGCHVYGDLCHTKADCCGGEPVTSEPSPASGANEVVCTPIPNTNGLGFCDKPNVQMNSDPHKTCVPEGDVCHFLNYACSNSSVRDDCCACISTKTCCQLDRLGIPRCNGIGGDGGIGCVMPGGICAFSGSCCGNLPCVPDSSGVLHCLPPNDGGIACVPQNGVCTSTADCCVGFNCVVPPGSLTGTCTYISPTPPPVVVPDSGVPSQDMAIPGLCAQYAQPCTAAVPCCNGITCNSAGYCLNPIP
jgi:hypothetical protein